MNCLNRGGFRRELVSSFFLFFLEGSLFFLLCYVEDREGIKEGAGRLRRKLIFEIKVVKEWV